MKIAILSENRNGFIKPMSYGLQNMLSGLAVDSEVFEQGIAMVDHNQTHALKTRIRNGVKTMLNRLKPNRYELSQQVSAAQVKAFEKRLQEFDLVVVVSPIPKCFDGAQLCGIERLRRQLDVPIVLYQNYYLGTRKDWIARILANRAKGVGFGLERYDWYLAASIVSDHPLCRQDHPVSVIGHDLRDEQLRITPKGEFRVLLDFARPGCETQRQIQIRALQEAGIGYTELKGRYSHAQIRALYRSHSALMMASRESFGLPIVENQLCGNVIFTPFAHWAPSHFIDKSEYQAGEGKLGGNFVVYDDDVQLLVELLKKQREGFDPERNLAQFIADYPHLYQGNLSALRTFVSEVEQGKITARSHQQYQSLLL